MIRLLLVVFWIANIVQVCNGNTSVLKVIGVLIAPLGAIMGIIGVFGT